MKFWWGKNKNISSLSNTLKTSRCLSCYCKASLIVNTFWRQSPQPTSRAMSKCSSTTLVTLLCYLCWAAQHEWTSWFPHYPGGSISKVIQNSPLVMNTRMHLRWPHPQSTSTISLLRFQPSTPLQSRRVCSKYSRLDRRADQSCSGWLAIIQWRRPRHTVIEDGRESLAVLGDQRMGTTVGA